MYLAHKMSARFTERKRRSTQMGSRLMRRKSRRSTRRRDTAKEIDEIPGLYQVKIAPSLQSVLSCRIGINITNSERWIYIYKQLLLDELANRNSRNDKDVLKIREAIEECPDEHILIGSYGGDVFLLCLSEYAKRVCENWKEEEKKQLMQKLFLFLYRDAFHWRTLGSDSEIERPIWNRSPFCTHLELQTHLRIKFDLRLVKDAKDGYVELVNTRTVFNNLLRKRLDKSCQVCGRKRDTPTQTIAPTCSHRCIQYNYTYPEIKPNKQFQQRLNEWFNLNFDQLSNLFHCNFYINIYTNDYNDLPNQKTRYLIENPTLQMSFHDCIACHDKMVNCIAWNAHFSGVIAAAYARTCPKLIAKGPPTFQENIHKISDTHLVLIWCITQPIKPLLYLHSEREITAMNFCPFNPNILIGGCTDGQIVVWDLKGKLETPVGEVQLQKVEVDVMIKEKMSWMKYPPGEQNVFPCVQSKLETSHKSHVTVIKWLPPEHFLSNQGEFLKCQGREKHMQFLTTALGDSTMLVWDLKPKNKYDFENKKKKKNRLASRPKILDAKKSSYAYLNTDFRPMFKLIFRDELTQGPIHVNDFSFKMGAFSYYALNPESIGNILERTIFVRDKASENFTLEKEFLAATGFGQLYHCSWTSHDYDQGLLVNRQNLETILCKSYHDGPIYHMQRSPFCADLVLTTGGRVFAIWDNIGEHIKKPIIWRKASIRYVMAVWSLQNAASIIAAREDGKIELWDFDEDSKSPLRMTKFIGDQLLSMFVNNSFHHVMKNTCITTDFNGILSIYTTPTKLFVYNTKTKVRNNIQRIYDRRVLLKFWIEYTHKIRGVVPQSDVESAEQDETTKRLARCSSETKRVSFEGKKTAANIWQEKEYNRMYKILIEKQRINLEKMEQNKGPLNQLLESRSTRARKIDRYIANKGKIFEEEKHKITALDDEMSRKPRINVHFPKELVKLMKEKFYENYLAVEKETNIYIQSHRYRYYFDWQAMMSSAKKRYDGDLLSKDSETSSHEYRTPYQSLFHIIPPEVGKRSKKFLMTEIALISNIPGK